MGEREDAFREAAIEADTWADIVKQVGCFSWFCPLKRARNLGQIFAYRVMAASLREMASSNYE